MIPFLDLQAVNSRHREQLVQAASRVIDSGWYVQGEQVERFETEFSVYCGTDHCVGVASGFDALSLTLRAWKELGRIADGDSVIVPANTYIASILAITENGLRPVLVEPDESTFNLSVAGTEMAITERTRVLLPVHLYGQLANMPALLEVASRHGLLVLEDAAQAHGARHSTERAGRWGHAAAFSFYPGKNLGALGDAGAVTTSDADLAGMLRSLGNYGSVRKYINQYQGVNSRLDEMQAALLRVKLAHLDEENEYRRTIARIYLEHIWHPAITLPCCTDPDSHVWHLFVIRSRRRHELQEHLSSMGVSTQIHYPVPPYQQAAFNHCFSGSFPITDRLHDEVLSLPINPAMTLSDAERVVEACNRWR